MSATSSRAGFIDTQRRALMEEAASIHLQVAGAEQAVKPLLDEANAAAANLRNKRWKQALANTRKRVLANAGKGSWLSTLSLHAIAGSAFKALLLWIALFAVAWWRMDPFWFLYEVSTASTPLVPLMGVVLLVTYYHLPLLIWGVLAWLGRRKLSRKRSASALAALDALGSLRPTLFALGEKATDGRSHPYPAVKAPAETPAQALDNWQLTRPHNHSHSVLVCLATAADRQELCIRLPSQGQVPGVAMAQGSMNSFSTSLEALAPLIGRELEDLAPPMQALLAAAEPLSKAREAQKTVATRMDSLDKLEANWKDVAIPNDTLETIIKLVDRFAAGVPPLPRGILLWGPPGTGKTLIARKLAQHVDCHFVAVTIADLKAEYIGQTGPKVKKLWSDARSKGPTILFVDECESAFARRGGRDTDNFGNELVQTFIAEWDGFNQGGGNVLVIGATNRRELIDDAVLSRFSSSIELPAPNGEARERILVSEFSKARLGLPVTEALVRETTGMSGRDLSTLVTNVVSGHHSGQPAIEDFTAAVARLRGKSSTAVQSLTWDDIILPTSTRREFESLGKELVHAEQLAKMSLPVPRGILLYGPPGTGKTQIARVLASQSGLSFIAASSADLKSSNIGASGEKVKQLFERARSQAPCILFLDELDTIARSRDGGDVMTTEIVAQMLQELDGIGSKPGQVFLLAATNLPDSIDAALLSRLERKIEVALPDLEARRGIIGLQLAGKPIEGDVDALCDQLAQATHGLSGRDLQSLVTAGTRTALQRAMIEHGDPTKVRIRADDLLAQVKQIA